MSVDDANRSSLFPLNIILFSSEEVQHPLPRNDPRSRHILEILRREPGQIFAAGLINGPRGKATLKTITPTELLLSFEWGDCPAPLLPIQLVLGLPRPQTARDILRECAALGIRAMHFVRTEKSDPGYGQSSLWKSGEWKSLLRDGVSQAYCTRIPAVEHGISLQTSISALPGDCARIALDNYESPESLAQISLLPKKSVALAVGAERGWSPTERDLLRINGFVFAHLGERVLRTETACIVAITLLKAKLGLP